MDWRRHELGKVFLSHSSIDKPFVRRLTSRLRSEGFSIWLDEKELLVGDSLTGKISHALESARVVIIVISTHAIASPWLGYELRSAASRMIAGKCRLIPVLIGDVDPPPELRGLLFADCRPGRRGGMKKIIDALDAEADCAALEAATVESADPLVRSRGYDAALDKVFGGTGFASMDLSATRTVDWDMVSLERDHQSADVVFEKVFRYAGSQRFDEGDWESWRTMVTEEIAEPFGLLLSERTLASELMSALDHIAQHVWAESRPPGLYLPSGLFVLVEMSAPLTDEQAAQRLSIARTALERALDQQQPALLRSPRDVLPGSPEGGSPAPSR